MKTKYWILLLTGIFAGSLLLSLSLFSSGKPARYARITSDSKLVQLVDLSVDQEIIVTSRQGGNNVVTVRDGKIGVTEATCPDHYCIKRGMCSGGAQIVCLPNRLVIQFEAGDGIDAISG